MAKLKLEPSPDPEVIIVGISSHVSEYRLCWSLNRALELGLTRRRNDLLDEDQLHSSRHAAFDHEEPDTPARVSLVRNLGSAGHLLRDHQHADYFLLVDDELGDRWPDLVARVRAADFVLAAFPLALDQLRQGHKLLMNDPSATQA
jgi:hypothetical protein